MMATMMAPTHVMAECDNSSVSDGTTTTRQCDDNDNDDDDDDDDDDNER